MQPLKDPTVVAADGVAAALQIDLLAGLTAAEAARRLVRDGPNALREAARVVGLAAVVIAAVVVATILLTNPVRGPADVVHVLLLGVALAVASVEALGAASVIATDKTGTLTQAEMTIVRVATASGVSDVTGVGCAPTGQVQQAGAPLKAGARHAENVAVLSGAAGSTGGWAFASTVARAGPQTRPPCHAGTVQPHGCDPRGTGRILSAR